MTIKINEAIAGGGIDPADGFTLNEGALINGAAGNASFGYLISNSSTIGDLTSATITFADATSQTTAFIDAPSDGNQYARKDAGWEQITNGGGAWGSITGTLSNQTNLQNALDAKYDASNPSGYITNSALIPYITSSTATSTFLSKSSNLSDVTSASSARSNLGLAYATDSESQLKTSTTSVINPSTFTNAMVDWCVPQLLASATNLGTTNINSFGGFTSLSSSASGQYAIIRPANGSQASFTSSGVSYWDCDYSKRIKIHAKAYVNGSPNNIRHYLTWGRSNNASNAYGDLVNKGFGIRITGGATPLLELQVHNGTTLTNVSATFTISNGNVFDVLIDSLGNGTVNLYINGVISATTNSGATGTYGTAFYPLLTQETSSTGSSAALTGIFYVTGRSLYFS